MSRRSPLARNFGTVHRLCCCLLHHVEWSDILMHCWPPQALAARRREAKKAQSTQPSKAAGLESSSDGWTPQYQEDMSSEYQEPATGVVLEESAFQVVKKPQKKPAQKKRTSGSEKDKNRSAAPGGKDSNGAAPKSSGGGGRRHGATTNGAGKTPASAAAKQGAGQQSSVNVKSKEKERNTGATSVEKQNDGRRGRGTTGNKRPSDPPTRAVSGSVKGKGGKAEGVKRNASTGKKGGKQQTNAEATAPPVMVKNAWFKNVPAPAPVPKPTPMVVEPALEPAPEPVSAMSPLASAKSNKLATVWSVGSMEIKTDSEEEGENVPPYGSGSDATMPSPVPRLAFAGIQICTQPVMLPPPRIQLGGRAEASPASASSIRFGDSPGSAMSGIKFGAFPSPMGSQKQSAADNDDDWRASSQPQKSPASAAAEAAAKMLGGGWGEPPPPPPPSSSRRSPTSSDGNSSFGGGGGKPPRGRSSSPNAAAAAAAAAAADSTSTGKPPLPAGQCSTTTYPPLLLLVT